MKHATMKNLERLHPTPPKKNTVQQQKGFQLRKNAEYAKKKPATTAPKTNRTPFPRRWICFSRHFMQFAV